MAAAVAVVVSLVVECMLEFIGAAPGIAKVVLRSGPERGWEFLPIHEELFVTLTPPTAAWIPDVEHHPDKPACALGLQHRPIDAALGLGWQEGIAMPFGMEAGELGDRLRKGRVGDFVGHHSRFLPLVDHIHLGFLTKWNIPRAPPPAVLVVTHRERPIDVRAGR